MVDQTDLLKSRIKKLNGKTAPSNGACVMYVMGRDQRVGYNHALIAAQKHALALRLPLGVAFCLLPQTGFRAREHYEFMLHGLAEVEVNLAKKNIPFILLVGDTVERLQSASRHFKPAAIYFDFSPLGGSRQRQNEAAAQLDCPCYIVDTHNIVPVWTVSDKQEVGARTLRPKIHHHLPAYLTLPESIKKHPHTWPKRWFTLHDIQTNIRSTVDTQKSNGQTELQNKWPSGEKHANAAFNDFIQNRLKGYATNRNDPANDNLSRLSPYLHFGQLSSLEVALAVYEAVRADSSLQADADSLIEEMVVRKELSDNFCYYNSNYKSLDGAPQWAIKSLKKHKDDPREFIYTLKELEAAKTHEPAWNAAQLEMVHTGKMHGYMRMYWAKKVLEWTENPKQALDWLIYLNDFYSIDGGDPNGYVGILWSIAGLHDRPWVERSVFGQIRYMNYNGLKRKFKIELYERNWLGLPGI